MSETKAERESGCGAITDYGTWAAYDCVEPGLKSDSTGECALMKTHKRKQQRTWKCQAHLKAAEMNADGGSGSGSGGSGSVTASPQFANHDRAHTQLPGSLTRPITTRKTNNGIL